LARRFGDDGGAGEVESPGVEHPRVLGRLPAEQGHPGLGTGGGDGADQRRHRLDVHRADGDVVGHRQRTGAGRHQVVDAHRHQVCPETSRQAGAPGQLGLGAHPVGHHHQHRASVTGRQPDAGGEAAEPADDLVAPGCGDTPTDAVDHGGGGGEVDPRLPVGVHHTRSRTNLSPPAAGTSVG
jgi:hypothetical protein